MRGLFEQLPPPLPPPQYLCIHLIGLFCGRRKNCLGGGYFSWPSYAGLCFRVGCGGEIFGGGGVFEPGFKMRGGYLGFKWEVLRLRMHAKNGTVIQEKDGREEQKRWRMRST